LKREHEFNKNFVASKKPNDDIRSHGSFYIPSLDGIRAIAATMVFVSHAGWEHVIPGGFGVTIFFFLSGYLITTLLRREFEHTGSISFKKFYLRRVYRIFPPLYIVLILAFALALTGVFKHQMTVGAVASQFFCWTNYYTAFYGTQHLIPATAVYWSLANEEHFYFVFPLLFWLAVRRTSCLKAAIFFAALCLLGLIWRYWLILEGGMTHTYTYYATDTRFDSLLYGCIMGLWQNPMADKDWKLSLPFRYLLLCLALMLLLFTFLWRDETFRETLRYSIQGIALFPVFWLAVRHPNWLIFRWLNWRPIRFFGVISYTFYLIHVILLIFTWRMLGISATSQSIGGALVGFALSVLFATAMYYFVERPLAGLRRKLHSD
jgi:peptidoglycan/LPS O-acetylase OafA/YrhL